jgi:O-methyltransferase
MNFIKRVIASLKRRTIRNLSNFNQKWFKSNSDLIRFNKILLFFGFQYKATYVDKFNLTTRMNSSCIQNPAFLKSIEFSKLLTKQSRPLWTSYNLIWAANHAFNIEGDFIECGVEKGFHSLSIIHYFKNNNFKNRKFYLLDSWEGVDINSLDRNELHQDMEWNKRYSGTFLEVNNYFKDYDFVKIVKGFIPDTLIEVSSSKIAFLHIDLNAVYPEVESLKFFWNKLSRGAIVILDDYNQIDRQIQKNGIDVLGEKLGYITLSLPTGQGMIIKN